MSLLVLAARVCRAFVDATDSEMRVVQKVKDDQARDVVTALDIHLHELSAAFVNEFLPGCRLASEEGASVALDQATLEAGEFLVVDPLDGSNNVALGMPGYGFMAAHVRGGVIVGAVIVLPEHDHYIVLEDDQVRTSAPLDVPTAAPSATTYYAYPPTLTPAGAAARPEVLARIDERTSGLYRSGSACIGLFNLLRGRHAAFVAQEVRIWDALAFMPLLSHFGFAVRYRLTPERLTLVASQDGDIVEDLAAAIGGELDEYGASKGLVLS
jgi:fructose-1,6-bisphosphatase/inositol monophosphatase family enzyme